MASGWVGLQDARFRLEFSSLKPTQEEHGAVRDGRLDSTHSSILLLGYKFNIKCTAGLLSLDTSVDLREWSGGVRAARVSPTP